MMDKELKKLYKGVYKRDMTPRILTNKDGDSSTRIEMTLVSSLQKGEVFVIIAPLSTWDRMVRLEPIGKYGR